MNSPRTLKFIIAGLLIALLLLLFNPFKVTTEPTAEVPVDSSKNICMDYETEK